MTRYTSAPEDTAERKPPEEPQAPAIAQKPVRLELVVMPVVAAAGTAAAAVACLLNKEVVFTPAVAADRASCLRLALYLTCRAIMRLR